MGRREHACTLQGAGCGAVTWWRSGAQLGSGVWRVEEASNWLALCRRQLGGDVWRVEEESNWLALCRRETAGGFRVGELSKLSENDSE